MLLRWVQVSLVAVLVGGCSCPHIKSHSGARAFNFEADSFAYDNELLLEYTFDPATGKRHTIRREPKPEYALHCFVVARSARQFLQHARFDASQPVADDATYERLIRKIVGRTARHASEEDDKIVIPGFANLREFSQGKEALLKDNCGGAWQSYVQRGNWRVVFPISRSHQERTVERFREAIRHNQPPIAHLVRFPALSINHAVVVYAVEEDDKEVRFTIYDPNDCSRPRTLSYDRATQTFTLPMNRYFPGGRVDVYEIYCGLLY